MQTNLQIFTTTQPLQYPPHQPRPLIHQPGIHLHQIRAGIQFFLRRRRGGYAAHADDDRPLSQFFPQIPNHLGGARLYRGAAQSVPIADTVDSGVCRPVRAMVVLEFLNISRRVSTEWQQGQPVFNQFWAV